MTKKNSEFKIIGVVISSIVLIIVIIFCVSFYNLDKDVNKKDIIKEVNITTKLKDKFLLKLHFSSDPVIAHYAGEFIVSEVYYINNNKEMKCSDAMYMKNKYPYFEMEYRDKNITAYITNLQGAPYVIYKYKNDINFKELGSWEMINPLKNKELMAIVPLAKKLFKSSDDIFVADFLAKAKDEQSIKLMKRYASGDFKGDIEEKKDMNSKKLTMEVYLEILKRNKINK